MTNALDTYTAAARRAMARAGILAADAGRHTLDDVHILLALTETRPFDRPPTAFTLTPNATRAAMDGADGADGGDARDRDPLGDRDARDRDLLAALGVDLDEVRRRLRGLVALDDPALWRLHRARLRPLRVTLSGPPGDLVLTGRARKVIEVAAGRWREPGPVRGEDLLWGVLCDHTNPALRVLRAGGVDVRRLAAELNSARPAA
ncbi:hypothetical protein Skr01_26940 [Sphaerisporangium krabiense]|uniref:Clp R domain-containing protein n=1 Tax=Sphaerisporangium krabiense TaxID=763782 RepID=A0A7W8ZAI4_9ACTN|nr:Clp protease N-terminal domain-containing protein [Sphaerisporangium krabiense]MBB5630438.1 hypothetical protein [Sphaerisporangium krabiense]GII62609.1 hypothetical protein Skr01_26940 [Sphaerisporangium krabiense]